MQINVEHPDSHSVQAYATERLKINDTWYTQNIIVNHERIIPDWTSKSIQDLDASDMETLLSLSPELIIMGHNHLNAFPNSQLIAQISQQRIGIESMSISAACRTYNVLISENRNAVLAVIW